MPPRLLLYVARPCRPRPYLRHSTPLPSPPHSHYPRRSPSPTLSLPQSSRSISAPPPYPRPYQPSPTISLPPRRPPRHARCSAARKPIQTCTSATPARVPPPPWPPPAPSPASPATANTPASPPQKSAHIADSISPPAPKPPLPDASPLHPPPGFAVAALRDNKTS